VAVAGGFSKGMEVWNPAGNDYLAPRILDSLSFMLGRNKNEKTFSFILVAFVTLNNKGKDHLPH
jgi:hypothetical protein